MTEDKKEKQAPHEHEYYPKDIYPLSNFWYILVRLECECGDEHWDIGEKVNDENLS